MPGQDWSITIASSGDSAFQPKSQDAENSDLISWNNRTGQQHQPWPATADYQPLPDSDITKGAAGCNYLSDVIEPWESSSPAYVCAAPLTGSTTIYYVCKIHPDEPREQGAIVVSSGVAS
jgi:hypothetical protein